MVQGGAVQFVRADHIHRPVFATDAAGAVVWAQSYDPFGRVVSGSGLDARFAGQWFASENGLHQNWMRDYDATLGRYIQADPLGLIDGASVYGYVRSNPAMLSDPTGQCPFCAAIVAGAIVGVATGYVLEETIGDGCYTWADAGRDAAIGAAFGPLGKAISLADDAARAGAGVVAAKVRGAPKPSPIKPGASGGPTAGKDFSKAVKDQAKKENASGKCVYCRQNPATQVDHAIAKARGGNATLENAQGTCPHCNASKGSRDYPVNPPPNYRGPWPPSHW